MVEYESQLKSIYETNVKDGQQMLQYVEYKAQQEKEIIFQLLLSKQKQLQLQFDHFAKQEISRSECENENGNGRMNINIHEMNDKKDSMKNTTNNRTNCFDVCGRILTARAHSHINVNHCNINGIDNLSTLYQSNPQRKYAPNNQHTYTSIYQTAISSSCSANTDKKSNKKNDQATQTDGDNANTGLNTSVKNQTKISCAFEGESRCSSTSKMANISMVSIAATQNSNNSNNKFRGNKDQYLSNILSTCDTLTLDIDDSVMPDVSFLNEFEKENLIKILHEKELDLESKYKSYFANQTFILKYKLQQCGDNNHEKCAKEAENIRQKLLSRQKQFEQEFENFLNTTIQLLKFKQHHLLTKRMNEHGMDQTASLPSTKTHPATHLQERMPNQMTITGRKRYNSENIDSSNGGVSPNSMLKLIATNVNKTMNMLANAPSVPSDHSQQSQSQLQSQGQQQSQIGMSGVQQQGAINQYQMNVQSASIPGIPAVNPITPLSVIRNVPQSVIPIANDENNDDPCASPPRKRRKIHAQQQVYFILYFFQFVLNVYSFVLINFYRFVFV